MFDGEAAQINNFKKWDRKMSEINQVNTAAGSTSLALKIVTVSSYMAFLLTFVYYMFFLTGMVVPLHIDNINPAPLGEAIVLDSILVALFALQHTVMASKGYKSWFAENFNADWERPLFVIGSTVVFLLLMGQWRSHGLVIWSVEETWAVGLTWAIYAAGWAIMLLSTFLIDHFHLFGLRQAFKGLFPGGHDGFVTPLFYKLVRHPMMTGVIILLWATPHMTMGHLLMAVGMTAYILAGIRFEEEKLVDELGPVYEDYRKTTPALFPGFKTGRK